MQIQGRLIVSDFLAAGWLHVKPRPVYSVIGIALLGLAIGVLYWSFFLAGGAQASSAGWWILASLIYLALLSFVWWPYKVRKHFEQSKASQRDFSIRPTERGLLVTTENGEMTLPWADCRKWKENKKVFLIYLTDAHYQFLPKRLFASPSDVESFRELLTSNVKTGS